jgi:UDP:flavonoid glycosyltransferase YjiC (YdhE family)
MKRPLNHRIAYFVSPHGYGHAARASAVMEAIKELDPAIGFEIFTKVPRWFFEQSLSNDFGYHPIQTDIGMVQTSPLKVDLSETMNRLNQFLPLDHSIIRHLAAIIKDRKCRLIICDIAPMGIAAAELGGLPSVLVENFTWDWIYEAYSKNHRKINGHIQYLKGLFSKVDYHIQTEPVCHPHDSDLTTFPVSRKMRGATQDIRKELGVPQGTKLVMITMGGIPEQYAFLEQLRDKVGIKFLILISGSGGQKRMPDNLILLPHHSAYYHPDLVNASDAVIGKVGYSTLAEIYYAGVPFGYVARKKFRESRPLVSFVKTQMNGLPISEDDFYSGKWLSDLPDLLAMPRIQRRSPRGAEQVAHFIHRLIKPSP